MIKNALFIPSLLTMLVVVGNLASSQKEANAGTASPYASNNHRSANASVVQYQQVANPGPEKADIKAAQLDGRQVSALAPADDLDKFRKTFMQYCEKRKAHPAMALLTRDEAQKPCSCSLDKVIAHYPSETLVKKAKMKESAFNREFKVPMMECYQDVVKEKYIRDCFDNTSRPDGQQNKEQVREYCTCQISGLMERYSVWQIDSIYNLNAGRRDPIINAQRDKCKPMINAQ